MPPIYEYVCEDCDSVFSILTTFDHRRDAQICPNCESRDNHPILSPTRTTFKFADRCAEKRIRAPKEKRR
jgi:putative FmdB family regulatory protein